MTAENLARGTAPSAVIDRRYSRKRTGWLDLRAVQPERACHVRLELTHPWFLLLALFGALALALFSRRSLADLVPVQRRAVFAVRFLLLLCIALALAGLGWITRGDDLGVVFLVDASASISPTAAGQARHYVEESLQSRRAHDSAGVLGFARTTAIWQPPVESSRLAPAWPAWPDAQRAGTDLAHALNFAGALTPAGKVGRVVLLSDGNDTAGGAVDAASRLAAAGVDVDTVPLRNPDQPEVLVAGLDLPPGLKSGEPFDARADIESNVATTTKVNLYQNQFLVAQQDVAVKPGRNDVVFPNLRAGDGFTAYGVEILPALDTRLENNRAGATAALTGHPRVLLVDSDEERAAPLAGALRDAQIDVEVRGPAGLPRTLSELQRFDLFMLSDVSALSMTRDQMELYRTWVQQFGGGFIMIGGENSFGVGGYYRTPIEQMLPVRMEHDDRQETPTVALYVVLDRSGSMTAPVADQTKISLADQGAVLALDVLQSKDLFGLTAVDTQVHTVVPLGPAGNRAASAQKILSITAGGGGIYIYTGLADAFRVMREATAKIKHVILFSDAADAEEKSSGEMPDGAPAGGGNSTDLVSAMLAEKITTSVVGLGGERDKDVTFLRLLAERGNGRFYLTNDPLTLPQIFSTETMKVAQSSLVEEPFNPVPAGPSPLVPGIDWQTAPPLLGYNSTKPKPTAQVALATELGEPLLASWRYGLGQAAAFTSDAQARWAGEWLEWDGYGKFWAQVVRGLLRKSEAAAFQVRTAELGDGARLRLAIDAVTPEGSFRDRLPIDVSALDTANGQVVSARAEQIGPGSYQVEFALPPLTSTSAAGGNAATTMISVSSPALADRPYVFGYTRSYPREYLRTGTDDKTLRAIASSGKGEYAPAPAEIFAQPANYSERRLDLTNYFLAAALLLLPLDIFLRRRTWRQRARSAALAPLVDAR
jgi:Ca-activated chloride channel family protein